MTIQEVFTKAKEHLLRQNAKANDPDRPRVCFYRDPSGSGRKCPVGALILDEFYRPEFEGKSARNPVIQDALRASGVPVEEDKNKDYIAPLVRREKVPVFALLLELQRIHDDREVSSWEKELQGLATDFGLKFDA